MVAGVAPDHIDVSGAVHCERRKQIADRASRRGRKRFRREGNPCALAGVHMACNNVDVVPCLAGVVEVAVHWIEDELAAVASSGVGRSGWVRVRIRKDQATRKVGRAG